MPVPPTALEIDPSLGLDRLQVAWTHSVTPDVVRYNVYQASGPGGPYTKVNVDPLDHAVYLATGLSANTIYYYVVTAIDASGNESIISGEFSASTNPPQSPNPRPPRLRRRTTMTTCPSARPTSTACCAPAATTAST